MVWFGKHLVEGRMLESNALIENRYYSPAFRTFIEEHGPKLLAAADPTSSLTKSLSGKPPLHIRPDDYADLYYHALRRARYEQQPQENDAVFSVANTEGNGMKLLDKAAKKILDFTNPGWIYRTPEGHEHGTFDSKEYTLHVRALADANLIPVLDEFSKKHGVKYKVAEGMERWLKRHDPVVMYSVAPWTDEQKLELQELLSPFIRKVDKAVPSEGEVIADGIHTSFIPTREQKAALVQEASGIDSELGAVLKHSLELRGSAGGYVAAQTLMKEFKAFKDRNPEIETSRLDANIFEGFGGVPPVAFGAVSKAQVEGVANTQETAEADKIKMMGITLDEDDEYTVGYNAKELIAAHSRRRASPDDAASRHLLDYIKLKVEHTYIALGMVPAAAREAMEDLDRRAGEGLDRLSQKTDKVRAQG